ncbi:MAG: GAF domain-containing protein, partial [Pseudomonadales bacterium]|nr:GAF domain-containing protein [Pseudomonadales bacterium]
MLQDTLNLLRRQFLGLNRVLSTVMELVNDGLSYDDEQSLLEYAARLLINNHNFQFCTLHLYEHNRPVLKVAVSTESILDPSRLSEESSPWVQTCEHLTREVYEKQDGHLLKRHAGDTVYYCMPFVYRGDLLGALSANSPGFDENHPKLISIFCRILTSVLINARQSQRLS